MSETSLFRRGRLQLLNWLRLPLRARVIDERLASWTEGRSPSDWIARVPAQNYLYPAGSLRRVVRQGLAFDLDISDYMEWLIYFGVRVEPRDRLLSLVRPGAIVVDVGANVGETALLMARQAGPDGRVFAFEPHPLIFARARRNMDLNPGLPIDLVQCGVGDEPGVAVLGIPTDQNRGGARIGATAQAARVDVTTLDRFVQERTLARIDLIKIDVEGFEYRALSGARQLLERDHPTLFIEVDDDNLRAQGSSARELVGMIEDLGYRLTHAQQGGIVRRSDPFAGTHFDVIGEFPAAS